MSFLSSLKNSCIEFLFPKGPRILELESLSSSKLLDILPRAENPGDKDTSAIFDYSHPVVKEVIWELKYGGNVKIARALGAILFDHINQELEDRQLFDSAAWRRLKPLLIPIPASAKRRFDRGWNQTELLSNAIRECDHEKIFEYMPRILAKTRHTESQTRTSSKQERRINLKDSMKVLSAPSINGRCVIVIDDVTTTGSTFAEARRVLREAGVKSIICMAVAH